MPRFLARLPWQPWDFGGRLAGGARLGIAAMALWFALPAAVRFSTEGSQYALVLFAMTYFLAASWAVWRLGRRARMKTWIHVTLSVAFVFWSSLLAWLGGAVAGAMVLGMLLARAARAEAPWRAKWFGVAGRYVGASALGMVLSIPVFWRYAHSPSPGFYAPFTDYDSALLIKHLACATLGFDWMEYQPGAHWPLLALVALACIGAVLNRRLRGVTIVSIFGAFAVGGVIIASLYRANHWIEFRYLMPALPFIGMASALGVVRLGRLVDRFTKRGLGDIVGSAALAAIVSACVWYVSTTPMPRADWRGAIRHIANETPTARQIFVVDFLDIEPVKYYSERFDLKAEIISIDRDAERLSEAIASSPGAWFVHREMWDWDQLDELFGNTFAELPEPNKELHFVHARQFLPWPELLSRAAESGRIPTLGSDEDKVTIRSRRDEPLRGAGWHVAEGWGDEIMLPISAGGARFAAVLDRAMPISIAVRAASFRPDVTPPLALELYVNDVKSGELSAVEGMHDYVYAIPASALHARANIFELRPSRALVPAELDSTSTDTRALSFWVSKITIRAGEEVR